MSYSPDSQSVRWNPVYSGEVYFDDQISPQSQVGGVYVGDDAPNVQGVGSMASPNMGSEASPAMMDEMDTWPMVEKPTVSWFGLVIILVAFIFISRKFGGPEKFGNIKLTLWNGLFATIFFVIILNFLKALAPWIEKVPFMRGVATLFKAA